MHQNVKTDVPQTKPHCVFVGQWTYAYIRPQNPGSKDVGLVLRQFNVFFVCGMIIYYDVTSWKAATMANGPANGTHTVYKASVYMYKGWNAINLFKYTGFTIISFPT